MSFKTVPMITDAVSASGAGAAHPNGDSDMTFVASLVGGTSTQVLLEGSQDGTAYFTLHTFDLTTDGDEAFVLQQKWKHLRGNVAAYNGNGTTDVVNLTKTS
jgi:hypothetical protein